MSARHSRRHCKPGICGSTPSRFGIETQVQQLCSGKIALYFCVSLLEKRSIHHCKEKLMSHLLRRWISTINVDKVALCKAWIAPWDLKHHMNFNLKIWVWENLNLNVTSLPHRVKGMKCYIAHRGHHDVATDFETFLVVCSHSWFQPPVQRRRRRSPHPLRGRQALKLILRHHHLRILLLATTFLFRFTQQNKQQSWKKRKVGFAKRRNTRSLQI